MTVSIDPRLLQVALSEAPALILYLRSAFAKAHPDVPPPTDAEVLAAFETLYASSLARDEQLLAEKPPTEG